MGWGLILIGEPRAHTLGCGVLELTFLCLKGSQVQGWDALRRMWVVLGIELEASCVQCKGKRHSRLSITFCFFYRFWIVEVMPIVLEQ